jgi:hypothetical protein
MLEGKIPTTDYNTYENTLNIELTPSKSENNGYDSADRKWNNCGFFAFDRDNNKFRVPKLDNRVFIANGSNIGAINNDTIVNFKGKSEFNSRNINPHPGALITSSGEGWFDVGNGVVSYHTFTDLDPSQCVAVGSRVQPRHQQYPYFICVSTVEAGIDPTIYAKTIELQSEIQARIQAIINLQIDLNSLKSQVDGTQQGKVFNTKTELDNWVANPYNTISLKVSYPFGVHCGWKLF